MQSVMASLWKLCSTVKEVRLSKQESKKLYPCSCKRYVLVWLVVLIFLFFFFSLSNLVSLISLAFS